MANRVTPIDGIYIWVVAFFKMVEKFDLEIKQETVPLSFRDKVSPYLISPYISLFEKGVKKVKKSNGFFELDTTKEI